MKDSNDKKTIDMLKPAPKTNAERQRAYRERIKNNNSQRLDVYLDKAISDKLADIVGAVGDSQKDVLSRLIEKEYKRLYAVNNSKLKKYVESKKVPNKIKPHFLGLFSVYLVMIFKVPRICINNITWLFTEITEINLSILSNLLGWHIRFTLIVWHVSKAISDKVLLHLLIL